MVYFLFATMNQTIDHFGPTMRCCALVRYQLLVLDAAIASFDTLTV